MVNISNILICTIITKKSRNYSREKQLPDWFFYKVHKVWKNIIILDLCNLCNFSQHLACFYFINSKACICDLNIKFSLGAHLYSNYIPYPCVIFGVQILPMLTCCLSSITDFWSSNLRRRWISSGG